VPRHAHLGREPDRGVLLLERELGPHVPEQGVGAVLGNPEQVPRRTHGNVLRLVHGVALAVDRGEHLERRQNVLSTSRGRCGQETDQQNNQHAIHEVLREWVNSGRTLGYLWLFVNTLVRPQGANSWICYT